MDMDSPTNGTAFGQSAQLIEIPLRGSDSDVLEIPVDDLPDPCDEVLQVLRSEKAQLDIWYRLAIEYYRQGKEQDFVKILEASRTEADLDYAKSDEDQMKQLDTLAAYYVLQANREKKNDKKREFFQKVI